MSAIILSLLNCLHLLLKQQVAIGVFTEPGFEQQGQAVLFYCYRLKSLGLDESADHSIDGFTMISVDCRSQILSIA